MKLVPKLIMIGTVLVLVLNYVAYRKSGTASARDWINKAQTEISKHRDGLSLSEDKTVKISKWTDAEGVVHYENRQVKGARTIELNPDQNVLPPTPIVKVTESDNATSQPKTMGQEMEALREAKHAQMDAIINK